jgi:hypothetical protein
MIVYTVTSESMLGTDVREFDSTRQAVYWIGVLIRNKVPYRLEFRYENRPKQHEFRF